MEDVLARIAALKQEVVALNAQIAQLGDRLGAGEGSVRVQLNPAIKRRNELSRQIVEMEIAAGIYIPEPAPMYGPPPAGFRPPPRVVPVVPAEPVERVTGVGAALRRWWRRE